MKNRLFLLSALMLLPALASRPAAAQPSWGLKAGLSVTQFSTDFGDTKWHNGGAGGISVNLPFAEGLSFAPELLYVRKGATLTSTNISIGGIPFGTVKTGFDLDYIEVPVLLRYTLPSAGPAKIFATGGPTVSFKVNEAFTASGIVGYSFDADQAKDTDYGVALGAGAAVQSGGIRWSLEGRWDFGLADVSSLPFGGDVKNTGALVMLGAEFPLGTR